MAKDILCFRVVAFVAQLVLIILKYISFPADVSTTIVFSSQVTFILTHGLSSRPT